MKTKTASVLGWICVGLVAAFTLFSAVMSFVPVTDQATIDFMTQLGIFGLGTKLATVKLIIVALYLWRRTSTVGFILMVGYYGGALATNITHQMPVNTYAPIYVVFLLMTIGAWLHTPEVTWRLRGKKI